MAFFQQRLPVLELYVELKPNHAGFNSQFDMNSQASVPNKIPENRTQPSSSWILEPITQPKTVQVRKLIPVIDYLHVLVDAIDDDSLKSEGDMLLDESSDSNDDVRLTRQSQSCQLQYPITSRAKL